MKPDFYIFLDIDGVLYDHEFMKQSHQKGIIKRFDPKCIEAFNYLYARLTKNYNPKLVISSAWRANMKFTIETLIAHDLVFDNIDHTPISRTPNLRANEILEYLKDKKDKNNFVIIDDEYFDFLEHFPKSKIIKTNITCQSLNKDMINSFFDDFLEKCIEN
ncbi:MAG: hypothetical protein IJA69_03430 [Clostridia bacterium]|nr:hypothetical protein [Clostridia bacterium]